MGEVLDVTGSALLQSISDRGVGVTRSTLYQCISGGGVGAIGTALFAQTRTVILNSIERSTFSYISGCYLQRSISTFRL